MMKNKTIHYFQQEPHEGCGSMQAWAEKREYQMVATNFFKGNTCQKPLDADLLIILGGSMNIYDEKKHPWLKAEKESIRGAIERGVRVVGICLGAQLVADALGAGVRKNEFTEIGWHPVKLSDEAINKPVFRDIPAEFLCMHWHEDTFDIPEGAMRIGGSKACKNQGFLWKQQVLALQFHLEFTPEMVNGMLQAGPELEKADYVQTAPEIHCVSRQQYRACNDYLDQILDRFMEL